MLKHKFLIADSRKPVITTPRNTVGLGDCRILLNCIADETIDLVVTDPSDLLISENSQNAACFNKASETILRNVFPTLYRVLKTDSFMVLCCGKAKPEKFEGIARDAGFDLVQTIWMERRWFTIKTSINEGKEYVLILAKGAPYKPFKHFSCPMPWSYAGTPLHPSQTAISVLKPFIKALSRAGDVVLDPFCGSGSTLCAAKELGRSYLGIDIDPLYVNRARRRLARK